MLHLLLIGCEVILRELCDAVARSPHVLDVEFLPKGLHDLGARTMRAEIQAKIDAAEARPELDAIVLGYGLCGNGLAGISARSKPLVLPRAHDCITLLLGSRQRFETEFREQPGTYYRSAGWVERGQELVPLARDRTGMGFTLDSLIERYGEDNGQYLYEELTRYQQAYTRLVYIASEIDHGATTGLEAEARAEAQRKGWNFERTEGDLGLFRRLLAADWAKDDDFLVVPPGETIAASYDPQVVTLESRSAVEGVES